MRYSVSEHYIVRDQRHNVVVRKALTLVGRIERIKGQCAYRLSEAGTTARSAVTYTNRLYDGYGTNI